MFKKIVMVIPIFFFIGLLLAGSSASGNGRDQAQKAKTGVRKRSRSMIEITAGAPRKRMTRGIPSFPTADIVSPLRPGISRETGPMLKWKCM